VADFGRVRKISPAGEVSTFAGDGARGSRDGTGVSARFVGPKGITIDAAGNFYVVDREDYVADAPLVADNENHRIRKISPAGEVSTFAGGGSGYRDGAETDARFDRPSGIAIDATGNLYVVDECRIRKITFE
jgi:DNA-binding beta-propeller fold protein YncE